MKVNAYFFSIILFFSFSTAGQEGADLLKSFQHEKDEVKKIELSLKIAEDFNNFPHDTIVKYGNYGLKNAQKQNDPLLEGQALIDLGNAYLVYGTYEKALGYYYKSKTLFVRLEKENPDDEDIKNNLAKSFGNIGIVLSEQSNYAKALQYHHKAKEIYLEIDKSENLSIVYNNIGVEYQSLKKYKEAIKFFSKCLSIQTKNNSTEKGITLTNIAKNYYSNKNKDQAKSYYAQAEAFFRKHPNSRGEGELYNNLGQFFISEKNPEKAFEYLEKAVISFDKIEDKFGKSDTYFYFGDYYLTQKDSENALLNYKKSLSLAKELGLIERQSLAEKSLAQLYAQSQNFQLALEHTENYHRLNDQLTQLNSDNAIKFSEMQAEFNQKEMKHLAIHEKSKRNFWIIILASLVLLGLTGILYEKSRKRQMKETLTLQKELSEYKQKALHLQMNPHFIFNCLGSISSFIIQKQNDNALLYLNKFAKLMRLTLENSKESTIRLDKEIVSLQHYLDLEKLRYLDIFEYSIIKDDALEDDLLLPPMLLQPLIENAIIHGIVPKGNGKIEVHFSLEKEQLKCTITDNGVGIETSKKKKTNSILAHQSMAIEITRKRIEMFDAKNNHGKFHIYELKEENEVKGTRVEIVFPTIIN